MKGLVQKYNSLEKSKKLLLLVILIVVINVLLYIDTTGYDFFSDDHILIEKNSRILNFENYFKSLNQQYFQFPHYPYLHYWRPVALLSFFLDYQVWELNPAGYHLTNILLNALCSLLLLLIFYLVTNKPELGFLISMAYSLHPARIEAVTWISGRTDLLAAIFVFLSVIFSILFIKRRKLLFQFSAILSFVLGLLSKELIILFPIVLIFIWIFYFKEIADTFNNWMIKLFKCVSPFIIISCIYFLYHSKITKIGSSFSNVSLSDVFLMLKSFGAYIKMIMLPFTQSPRYFMSEFDRSGLQLSLIAIFSIVILILILFKFRKELPATFFSMGLLIFMLPLLNLNIMPSYPKILMRFVMIPSVFSVVFYLEISNFIKNIKLKRLYHFLLGFLLIMALFITMNFKPYYINDSVNMERMSEVKKTDVILLGQRILIEMNQRNFRDALLLTGKALQMDKDDRWVDNKEQILNLKANILLLMGQIDRSKSVILDLINRSTRDDMKYYAYVLLAKIYEKEGNLVKALLVLDKLKKYGENEIILIQRVILHGKLLEFDKAEWYLDKLEKKHTNINRFKQLQKLLNRLKKLKRRRPDLNR